MATDRKILNKKYREKHKEEIKNWEKKIGYKKTYIPGSYLDRIEKAYGKKEAKEWENLHPNCIKWVKINMNNIEQSKEYNKKIFLWIVDYFFFNDRMPTLEKIGREFNFTRERARQKIGQMVRDGWIIKKGKGKSGAYFPSLKAIDKIKYGKSKIYEQEN